MSYAAVRFGLCRVSRAGDLALIEQRAVGFLPDRSIRGDVDIDFAVGLGAAALASIGGIDAARRRAQDRRADLNVALRQWPRRTKPLTFLDTAPHGFMQRTKTAIGAAARAKIE